jgi:excisionase family DNA binding protein
VGSLVDPERLPPTLSVEEAGALLGLSRSAAYRAAQSGELRTLRYGRRLLVPTVPLLRLLDLLPDGEPTLRAPLGEPG